MTARPPRRKRQPPTRKQMQQALKAGMAILGERISLNIFFLFSLAVIAAGIWMWSTQEARVLANMFIAIGIISAIAARIAGR